MLFGRFGDGRIREGFALAARLRGEDTTQFLFSFRALCGFVDLWWLPPFSSGHTCIGPPAQLRTFSTRRVFRLYARRRFRRRRRRPEFEQRRHGRGNCVNSSITALPPAAARGESASFHTPREHHDAILEAILEVFTRGDSWMGIHYSSPTHPFTFVMLSWLSANIQRNEG